MEEGGAVERVSGGYLPVPCRQICSHLQPLDKLEASYTVGVAQLVERWIVVPVAEGSNPSTHPREPKKAVRQLRGQTPIPRPSLSTKHLHSLPVVFEVAESVRLPADVLHLVVEAFGDAVGPSEAPHARAGHRNGDPEALLASPNAAGLRIS